MVEFTWERKSTSMGARNPKVSLRRNFLKQAAALGGASLFGSGLSEVLAQVSPAPVWKNQIGLELYTVRDLMMTDFEGVLAKVAQMGYREVEPASGYNNMSPKTFRAMLDRYSLRMPSTHSGARGTGAELEKQLEGFQIMGIKYTEILSDSGPTGRVPDRKLAPGAYYNPGTGITRNSFTETEAFGPYQPPVTIESVRQRAAQLNANGKIARKFGMKIFIHNHTGEFEKLSDSDRTTYDVLLSETDPDLVTMQLDIGWAAIAGMDVIDMFRKNPGRYELWHLKDVVGLKTVNRSLSPNARVSSMAFVPLGAGQLDYKPIFANATLAGLKHFCVEQDDAASWGDSLAAARVSCQNLLRILS
jgi:sugar phosphate isomerase/epimerase